MHIYMDAKQTGDTNKLQTHDSLWAAYLIRRCY